MNNPNPTGSNVIETIIVLKFLQVQGSLQLARKVALDQEAYESEDRGLKSLKILGFSRCNEGTIVDGAVNNPNPTGCNVIETIIVLKFPQVQGSLQLARKVALDQIAYENEARGVKSLKILGFSRCNEGTIVEGAVNNPNPTGSNVIETIIVLKFLQVQGSLQLTRKVALDQVAYESEARGLKSLKILGFSRCNEGTIVDGAVNNPNPTGCNVIETIIVLKFPQVQGSLQLARKVALDQIAYENEARGVKSLKILGFSRCNEGTIVEGAVNNPNPTGSNVIETIIVLKFLQVQGSLQLARKVSLDQIVYENESRGAKSLKILGFSRCNDGTIVDGAVNSPNPTGCNVIETISVLKFSQVKGSLQLARKVALDQIAYENEARSLKRLKILDFSRCNEGKIVDGAVNNPIRTGCNVIKAISALKFSQGLGSLQLARKVALDQIAYENEARCLKSFSITKFQLVQ